MVALCSRHPLVAMRLGMAPSARAATARSCPPELPARAARLLAFRHQAEERTTTGAPNPCAHGVSTPPCMPARRGRAALWAVHRAMRAHAGGGLSPRARLLPPLLSATRLCHPVARLISGMRILPGRLGMLAPLRFPSPVSARAPPPSPQPACPPAARACPRLPNSATSVAKPSGLGF